ncbi:MAG: sulfatase-like hydrolase/transferase [Rikenellaceae bacterium]
MNKKLILGATALVASSQVLYGAEKDENMNVLFLLVDDLRWNSLHCMGTDYLITPNIDALASDGVLFSNAYVTTSVSCVSRASIFTGQYMSRHGITDFGRNLTPDKFKETYPAVLKSNGYWTGMVGKYGVGPTRKGDFDFTRTYEGKHWYAADGSKEIEVLGGGYTRIGRDSIHVTERNIQDALHFLKERPDDQPFCLSVGFYATHAEDKHPDQYRYQPQSESLYQDIEIPLSDKATDEYLRSMPEFLQSETNEGRVRWHWRYDTPEKYQTMMKAYYRLLTEVDEGIGRIVAQLKEDGVYENTLIVFMGDNGYFHSERQLADKWYPYDESVRVPLIIHDPRLDERSRNVVNEEIVLNIDLAPTILAATETDIPESMQGSDMSLIYSGKKSEISKNSKNWRQDFFYEHPIISNKERIPSSLGLISLDKKYILWPDYGVEEYFNLKKDPTEAVNQINNEKYSNDIEQIKVRFSQFKDLAK